MVGELVFVTLFLEWTLDFPKVDEAYVRTFGFDARILVVLSYLLSIGLRIYARHAERFVLLIASLILGIAPLGVSWWMAGVAAESNKRQFDEMESRRVRYESNPSGADDFTH